MTAFRKKPEVSPLRVGSLSTFLVLLYEEKTETFPQEECQATATGDWCPISTGQGAQRPLGRHQELGEIRGMLPISKPSEGTMGPTLQTSKL